MTNEEKPKGGQAAGLEHGPHTPAPEPVQHVDDELRMFGDQLERAPRQMMNARITRPRVP
jgi:hypothetical protein